MQHLTATYSPEDNKLRLYSLTRLDKETYERVAAAGFKYAPKQELFFAPAWTPQRHDLLVALCGEVGDEDKSLADRAEERADRFDNYSESRASEAQAARRAVSAISDHIPLGQPILVGHHSERRARKDAERIENGMRRAVNLWETSEYWTRRAAAALAHAQHKERPDVRARRIKGLEADKRKQERNRDEAAQWLKLWSEEGLTHERALKIANMCWLHLPRKEGDREDHNGNQTAYGALTDSYPTLYAPRTLAEVVEIAKSRYPRTIAHADRWIAHFDNRIAYERAMLQEQGGLVAEKFDLQPGGQVLVRGEWATIIRVTKRDGKAISVTTNARYVPVRQVEEIKDYKAPSGDVAAAVKKATAVAPITNYPRDGAMHITKAQWDAMPKDYKGYLKISTDQDKGAHRVRRALGTFLPEELMTGKQKHNYYTVFLTDDKRKDPPPASAPAAAIPKPEPVLRSAPAPVAENPASAEIDELKNLLKAGVQVVSAPQLFPTPDDLADRVAELAEVADGARVLEPSAGTGSLIRAMLRTGVDMKICAVEINAGLVKSLESVLTASTLTEGQSVEVLQRDFMDCKDESFDVIVMNPPFVNAQDIQHIRHAQTMLAPGGRLVAICANGPRQNDELKPLALSNGGSWEVLPAGTFKESGTMVSTALLTIRG
ncbi:DUF3560 domain-containing protein (plasmid) [Pseudoduganella sp. UC29_106]|uniref:DUF3560 domain-containing protein n=1 Tax=Pseudoduganella sp. UC29_106 TaxID=3374553 RepID=UPI0037582F2B